jgi:hypothetical protein
MRPFSTLCEGAGTWLLALLLGSNPRWRFLGRAGVSPKTVRVPKIAIGATGGDALITSSSISLSQNIMSYLNLLLLSSHKELKIV